MSEGNNINLVLKQESDNKASVLSMRGILAQAKRLVTLWLAVSILVGLLTVCGVALFSHTHVTAKAMVEFSFDGIEKGLDPAGNAFDMTKIMSPVVIESALTSLGMSQQDVSIDAIRNAIAISSLMPEDAAKKISGYQNVLNIGGNNAMQAMQAILATTYFPTQYVVSLNVYEAGLDAEQGTRILDAILNAYKQYFFETYGYNRALGSAVLAVDYRDYDYERAVEVLDDSLAAAQKYVNTLSKETTSGFRSNETGYTFSDLYSAIGTLRSEDLDWINSYITVNNVTKDKDSLLTYYQYKIESLERNRAASQESLTAVTESISTYQKDTVVIMGGDKDTSDMTMTQASEAYDKMIDQKISIQQEIADYTKRIGYYNSRVEALRQTTETTSAAQQERLDGELDSLYKKVTGILDQVNLTAEEYFQNVAFANAFTITAPASASIVSRLKATVSSMLLPLLLMEILIFCVFLAIVVLRALSTEMKKKASDKPALATDTPDADSKPAAEPKKESKKN